MVAVSGWALGLLITVVALGTLIVVGILAVLAIALVKLNKSLDRLTTMAEPLAIKASDTLENVQRVTMTVGEKTDQILSRTVLLTESVSGNVERTAEVVNQTVTTPLIKLSSVIAGVSKGFSVYTSGGERNNGHSKQADTKE